MKVKAFIFNLSKGGAQGVFVNVVNYFYEQNMDVEIVVQNLNDAVYKDRLKNNIEITNLGVPNAKKLYPVLRRYLLQHSFSHAIAFSPEIAVNLYLLRKQLKLNFKIIGRCLNTLSMEYKCTNNFFRKYITSRLIRIFFHRINFIIAQSNGMEEDLIQNWGVNYRQVKVINNALQPQYESVLEDLTESEKSNYILYAGRFEPQKGLMMLLKAFANITDKSISLKLIGSGSMKADLENLAGSLHINDRVEFISYSTNIIDYYKRARLVVMTSFYEGFPNVLVESTACGTPIVAFDLPSGPNEIIKDDINGYLVPYLNLNEFTEAINKALEKKWDFKEIKNTAKRYSRIQIMPKYIEALEEA